MHPRNPYFDKKPDFAALSKTHAFLGPFVTIIKGKGHIDFKNKDALRALSRALLLEDFHLNVIIPLDSLVPVIPQRLNYILWLEDIFKGSAGEQLRGLDIGTGGTAVYALLCARKNNWKMVGTDIQQDSVDFARKNIERNGLTELVEAQLTRGTSDCVFFSELEGKFHFSMCNPPFFSSEQEAESLGKSRNLNRPPPSAAKTGTSTELVASGGEAEFLSKMILESKQFSATVGVFTSMIGIKSDLKFLENFLKANKALAYTSTSFVQGKTMRWGLAWTFDPKYACLLSSTSSQVTKSYAPVEWKIDCSCPAVDFVLAIKRLLSGLKFTFLVNNSTKIEVIAETNTWSNQRRKRRAEKSQDSDECDSKRMKLDEFEAVSSSEFLSATLQDYEGKSFVLHCEITFLGNSSGTPKVIKVKFIEGTLGIDAVHQVLQYLRNSFVKHTCFKGSSGE